MRPDRHAFVLLNGPPRAPVCGGELAEIEAWRRAGLPFVVASAKAGDPPDSMRLGLATPDKRRIGFRVETALVGTVLGAPSLAAAKPHAPGAWAGEIARVEKACAAADVEAFVFGSLAWTCRTNERFLHEGSDLDLLLVPGREGDPAALREALDALLRPAGATPRLDGELRLFDGSAVALREFARGGPDILVKAHGGPRLAPVREVDALVRGAAR